MEKPSKDIQKLAQDWVKEAGLQQPPANFTLSVMQQIEKNAVSSKAYRPLVSKRAWFMVAAVFIAVIALLFLFPSTESGYLETLALQKVPRIENPLAGIQISKTMIYGIGFLALFLIQVPFLKRQFVR